MIRLILGALVLTTALSFTVRATDRPNIVLILADDLGFECLSCYGGESVETPHLDALSASGMRFRHAHSQPICTPSRVQIMTGIHNNRNYVKFGYLDPEAITFAHVLRETGYRTFIAGKWQLGGGFEAPAHFGFDDYCLWQLTRRPSRYPNPGLEIKGKEVDFKNGEFGPDLVTDAIVDFLDADRGGAPFLVYYPMILPHWPFVPTPGSEDWDPEMWQGAKGEPGGWRDSKYWPGMVRYTDKMVGKVVDALEERGLRDNTLVIFTGDNGTYTGVTSRIGGRDYPGGKGSTRDNGTHVPFLASWPGVIEAETLSDELVDFTDVFPTLVDVAGVEAPAGIEGVSLYPVLSGEGERDKEFIYCWYHRNGDRDEAIELVRDRRSKLYANGDFFDLETDPWEENPLGESALSTELAQRKEKLVAALAEHRAVTRASDPSIVRRQEEWAAEAKKNKGGKRATSKTKGKNAP